MRKQIPAILLALMLGLCGCSDYQTIQTTEPTGETEKITETAEAGETERLLPSESRQEEAAEAQEKTEIPESLAQAAEPEEAEPQETKKQAKADEAKSGKPAETAKPENKGETESEKAKETPPAETEKPQDTPKSDELPAPSVTEASAQKTAYDFEFDMESIKADCISIGQSMGLTLDASLTPSNAAYWNPVAATQNNQGETLKRNLESYIKFHTPENIGSYGMDEVTDFNIYYEARGNGEYLIYFLFA